MNGTLKLINNTLAYGDVGATSNPTKKYVDWAIQRSYAVANPKAQAFDIDPGASLSLFTGVRTTTEDNTTQFTLTQSPLSASRYRFTFSAGTDPTLRTARTLALAGRTVTVTVNNNASIQMTTVALDWSAVQVGDTVFIPDTTTGDAASPFNPLNVGYWTVLAVDAGGSYVQLQRPTGVAFTGIAESVVVASSPQVLAYSAAGVQVGDSVNITAGFSSVVQGMYKVDRVTSKWFEVISTNPLPTNVSAIPTATGLSFFTLAKRYVRVEADQNCILRLNGDTGSTNTLVPWVAGDPDNTAFYEKVGPCWSLTVVNQSNQPLNLLFISAE